MGRRRGSSTTTTVTTTATITTAVKGGRHAHSTDSKPPLKAFKLWCLKRCSRSSAAVAASPGSLYGSEAAAAAAAMIESQNLPIWMRDGSLDPAIWSHLPDEIHEHILAFLPFPTLFRCATVCKGWRNSIAHGAHIRLTRAASTAIAPWPAYCPVRYTQTDSGAVHCSGFSLATNRWQPLPRLRLPPSPGKSLITGAGGLLAVFKPSSISVCNPVTGHRRELPPTTQKWSRPDVLHMIALSSSYKLILAGTEAYSASKPQPTEVYDSATNAWTTTGSLPAGLYLDTQDAALESNNVLYCTAQKAYTQAGDALVGTDALVAYDVARGAWSEVASHLPDESARQTPLICGGRVVMAVAPVDDDGPVGCFYALDPASRRWERLAAMPEDLHRRVRSWGVCSVVGGEHIVVVSDTAQGCVVAYHVATGAWSERRSPIKFGKSSRVISSKDVRSLASISFHPDVNAVP